MQEFGEHQNQIKVLGAEKVQLTAERDKARAELEKAAKKKVKLDEIESIEAKKSIFGKKVTLFKEDYDKLNNTAKKYVAMEKTTKKLKSEHDTAVQERDAMKTQLTAVIYSNNKETRSQLSHTSKLWLRCKRQTQGTVDDLEA